jgi:hypothetical protein
MGLAVSTAGSCGNHDDSGPGRHFTRSSELTTRVYNAVREHPELATDRTLAKWLKLLPDLDSSCVDVSGQTAIAIESLLRGDGTAGSRRALLASRLLPSVRRRMRLRSPVALVVAGLAASLAGIVGVLLLVGTTIVGIDPQNVLSLPVTTVQPLVITGAMGSVVSVLVRLPAFARHCRVRRFVVFMVGFGRPMIGASFSLFLYLVLDSGLLPIAQPERVEVAYFAAIGFIAGFSERLVPDLLGRAERQLDLPTRPVATAVP